MDTLCTLDFIIFIYILLKGVEGRKSGLWDFSGVVEPKPFVDQVRCTTTTSLQPNVFSKGQPMPILSFVKVKPKCHQTQ